MSTNVPVRTPTDAISYADLYARWEKGNWSAMAIDFTEDARQWQEEFTEFEREAALWNYALFFWGEDAVADGLSPYIDAAPLTPATSDMKRLKKTAWRASSTCCVARKYFCSSSGAASM